MIIDGQEYVSCYGLWPTNSRAAVEHTQSEAHPKGSEAREPFSDDAFFDAVSKHSCIASMNAMVYQKLNFGKLD